MKQLIPIFVFLVALFVTPAVAQAQKYTCPMHPHYVADRPGACPICGMDLVPLEEEEKPDPQTKAEENLESIPERTAVTISPETIQATGIRSETAQMASFGTLVRSYGDVTENIRLQFDVSGRVDGWIEELTVKAIGDEVKEGSLLFRLYSPALISAQQDYLSALQTGVSGRIRSSSKRLVSLGMQERVIGEVKQNRKAFQSVPYYAETSGLVSAINVREGTYAKPGMNLLTLQNYETVWIDVSIAEQDIPYINRKTKALVSVPTLGIKDQEASIDYIYPTINKSTRTGRVRLVLANHDGSLKPGAYADVEFETGVEQRLSIPSDAILKSKDGDYVVVALDHGRFQPRKILSGLKHKSRTEVLNGLSDGDRVVVSGQFLIDSESALRESFRKMQRMQVPLSLLEVSDDQLAMIDHLIDASLYMHEELVAGRMPNPKMIMPAITLGDHLMPVFRGTKLQFILEDAEASLKAAQDNLTEIEWQESLEKLVAALKPWLLEGKPQHYKSKGLRLFLAHGQGGYWLQLGQKAQNPFGEGHPTEIEWPEKIEAAIPKVQEMPAGGGHANH